MTSQIREFFTQQTIFITGGTGILGKILIEKLLRDCCDLKKIYILIRPRQNRSAEERFAEFFDNPCFNLIKSENLTQKVRLVNGDCKAPNLGLSPKDSKTLTEETTCIIHAAANVSFNQTLREATAIVKATRDVLDLAKEMTNLKVLVYISTLYSNCIYPQIKEEFYDPPINMEALLELVDNLGDNVLQNIIPDLLGEWPNTYVYAKCISENLVKMAAINCPVAVVRPAVVINASWQPIPGWIDKMYNIVAVTTGASLGTLRCCHARNDYSTQMVPVDLVSNCVLAAAWKTAREEPHSTIIYNYSGLKNSSITHEQVTKYISEYYWKTASTKAVWYSTFQVTENRFWFNIRVIFLHTLVAYFTDFLLYFLGKPPIAVAKYGNINKSLEALGYFATRQWKYHDNNVEKLWNEMEEEDKRLFNFNMENFNWDIYFHNYFYGVRKYLLNDPLETIPQGQKKLVLLMIIHYVTVILFCILMYKLLTCILFYI